MNWLLEIDQRWSLGLMLWVIEQPILKYFLLFLAVAPVYLVPITLIWLYFRGGQDRRASLSIALIGVVAWLVISSALGAYFYTELGFRERPFGAIGLNELFFEQPAKSFPSDHAALLTAIAASFYLFKYRRLSYWFAIILIISGFARVAVGFHYFGDIIAGLAIGALTVLLAIGLIKIRHASAK